jgi:hypothetical protein
VWSAVIRAMPRGNVGTVDGIGVSFSDGRVRYRQVSLTVSVDGIRSRSSYAHRHAVASAETGQEDLQGCSSYVHPGRYETAPQ